MDKITDTQKAGHSPVKRPKLIIRHRIGPAGQCGMARESYVISARAMTRGAKPLA
ncbi:MAG: hypothetical protein INF93_11705 [Rhodobacter sp.]|nr:hypothetical protein [Rhodobacter sp.]